MEEAFTAYLIGSVSLQAIISNRADWNIRPQASNTPSITLSVVSSNPTYSDEGDANLTPTRIQIDSWAKTYALSKSTSRAVFDRLNSNGAKFNQGNFEFQISFKEDENESFERSTAGEELYRVQQDFIIWYKEIN